MSFKKKKEYIGNINQLFSVKKYQFIDGKQDSVKAIDINNGAGIDMTILLDKCMDFAQLKFKSKNLNFITPTGIVSPQFYDDTNADWLKSWTAGFLTTCGLSNIGSACIDQGEKFGIHGRLSNTPAENISISVIEEDEIPVLKVTGTMKQAVMFGENLTLKRTVTCRYGVNEIEIEDDVYNDGYKTQPIMLLYHFNIGYPLLSENARLFIPSKKVSGRDEHAQEHIKQWNEITPPVKDFQEMCFYHDIEGNADGMKIVGIDNEKEELSVRIHYNGKLLDHFVQWKMLGKGEYVMGLEPCNATIDGRSNARENKSLKEINPNEHIVYKFKIVVSDKIL